MEENYHGNAGGIIISYHIKKEIQYCVCINLYVAFIYETVIMILSLQNLIS